MRTRFFLCVFAILLAASNSDNSASAQQPIVDESVVFAEAEGLVAIEAEHFFDQTKDDVRAFYLTTADQTPGLTPDADPNHAAGASGGAYLEILPDTRRNHSEKLIKGENFSPEPGKMAILHYKVHFTTPGKYYVWARAHSTGPEDNGLHVGIDGTWPESGQRLQWCDGKKRWTWESKQRTKAEHCGEPYKIFLEVAEPGEHVVQFSMREDGFEFDKFILTTDRQFARPDGVGPAPVLKSGTLPKSFPLVESGTKQNANSKPAANSSSSNRASQLTMPATMFNAGQTSGYYLHNKRWLAVNPNKTKSGKAARTFPYPTGTYHLTLRTVGENDGSSTYAIKIDGVEIGTYVNPMSKKMFEEGKSFHKTWKDVTITEGAVIEVSSTIGTDGKEYSRARWSGLAFTPADKATRQAAAPLMKEQARSSSQSTEARNTSPTTPVSKDPLQLPRQPDGDGSVQISGEPKTWHAVTLDLSGPYAHEKDNAPNPFVDYRMTVDWTHSDGTSYRIPGYFAADGNASDSSAESGTTWRSQFAPDRTGRWSYKVSFHTGAKCALDPASAGEALAAFSGTTGTLAIEPSDKSGRDLRAHGRLQYTGKHYLQFAGSGHYFLKVGADAPETLLAYADFDNTIAGNAKKAPIKTWSAHVQDWNPTDPTWAGGKGKGLIGAVNYLSGKGCNAFSFLTYNAAGDGDNVWPFIHRDDKLHYDCSKLDQWGTVFNHATAKGMYLHFKMQETENDDHKTGKSKRVDACLDGGNLGVQRKLYCRELIARFGHNMALNWNLGEENTQTHDQQVAMIDYIADVDAYDHPIVIHTYPEMQDKVYRPLLGSDSRLTGASLQNSSLETTHAQTVKWVTESAKAGKPWVVAFDESGSAAHAQCPDLGYNGFDGRDNTGKMIYTQHKVRKQTLWGTLMGGGAGCEYYFGYRFDQNDIMCEDWRSRDRSWDYCRIAIGFFHDHHIPFWEMSNADHLVGNAKHDVSKFCFAKPNETYVVYLPEGGDVALDLSDASGAYRVQWFNPRDGGDLQTGAIAQVTGGQPTQLGNPPSQTKGEENDWVALLTKQ